MKKQVMPAISRRALIVSGIVAGGGILFSGALSAQAALDAAELGVQPDLGDDQTSNIATALESSAARGLPLLLKPGRYVVSGLQMPDGARLIGSRGSTRLVAGGRGPVILASGVSSIAIAGLEIEGLRLAGEEALVSLTGVQRAEISDCSLVDSAGNGVKLVACTGRIEGCSLSGMAGAAVFALDCRDSGFSDNTIADCGNNGILVWQSEGRHDGAIVRGNRITGIRADDGGTGQNGNAINVYRAGGVSVVDNHLGDCAFSAVRNNAGADIIIARNQCRNLGEVALYAEFEFQGAVISDNLVHGAAQGISATNAAEGGRMAVISGNIIREIEIGGVPEDRGIGIGVEADASVTGNIVEGAAFAGLSLGWGPHLRNVVAANNVIRRARYGIAVSVAEGAGPALLTGNMISQSEEAAIAGFAWHDLVERDLAGEADSYPHLTIAGNVEG